MCQVKVRLYFHERVKDPIFTITIRNRQGTDITGTNCMFVRVETGTVEAGETQAQVAQAIGAAIRQYQRYESGEQKPGLDYLCALADHFGVSLDYLACRTEER